MIELRASNWGSGTSEGAVGNFAVYPSDNGYYYSDYPLGMVSSLLITDLPQVTLKSGVFFCGTILSLILALPLFCS